MTLRQRHITAILLLAVWPMTLGLATGWHIHSHSGDCSGGECVSTDARIAHSHDHHHHGHDHSHEHHHAPAQQPENDRSPTPPHNSEDCQSCQILALTGASFLPVLVESGGEILERLNTPCFSSPTLDAPSCFHLRGPPAEIAV